MLSSASIWFSTRGQNTTYNAPIINGAARATVATKIKTSNIAFPPSVSAFGSLALMLLSV